MSQLIESDSYKVVFQGGTDEVIEKKSRFIAESFPIESEEDAAKYIEAVQKKYWDARHHCYAYTLGRQREICRYSDDGEPGGTAGKPILEVLMGARLCNSLIVVTRYFGGTLLGTGGLVRAYSKAAKACLDESRIVEKKLSVHLNIESDYSLSGKIQYLAATLDIPVIEINYQENVTAGYLVEVSEIDRFTKQITEVSSGAAGIKNIRTGYAAVIENKIHFFDT